MDAPPLPSFPSGNAVHIGRNGMLGGEKSVVNVIKQLGGLTPTLDRQDSRNVYLPKVNYASCTLVALTYEQ